MRSQCTIVSNPGPRVFHLQFKVIRLVAKALFWSLAILSETPASDPVSTVTTALSEPKYDSLILRALDQMDRAAYASADSLLWKLPDIPARAYFRGLVLASRCDDLGDTAALTSATSEWERIEGAADIKDSPFVRDPQYGLYRGLSELQLSYVASVRGGRIASARLGRKAVKTLQPFARYAEAEAALALYDYYKAQLLQGVSWLPFVNPDRVGPLRRLEAAIPRSRYLKDILETSLLWIYYDAARYDAGLPAIREFLARYPGHRRSRQMLADFLFRRRNSQAADLDSALTIHANLALEYRAMAAVYPPPAYLPIGYLCSVGNLAKIYALLPPPKTPPGALERQLTIWSSPRYSGMISWLPASLVREVESLKKENQRRK